VRESRYVRLISWTLRSGSEQYQYDTYEKGVFKLRLSVPKFRYEFKTTTQELFEKGLILLFNLQRQHFFNIPKDIYILEYTYICIF
jgi:hypothetical protein